MKTVISTFLVVAMAVFPAVAQSGKAKQSQATGKAKAKSKAGDYYPLKVGTKWHYELDAGAPQKVLMTSIIAAEENTDGKPLARLEVMVNGQKAPATEHLMTNEKGVFRVKMNNQEVTPPLCLLKYPLKDGQTWESKTTVQGQQMDVSCRQGAEEDVQVPAGKYRAIPCTIQLSQGPMKFVTTYWFVQDIGFVRQKIEIGGRVINMELTKYEPAK